MAKEAKNQEHKPNAAVQMVKAAFAPVRQDEPYVSHAVITDGKKKRNPEVQQPPTLETANHGFYIGKIIRRTVGQKIMNLLGWKSSNEPMYQEEFITGSLEYLFAQLKPGEKLQIIVGPVLSEIFNGPKDVENALTVDEEAALIYRIAEKRFGKSKDQIEVIDMEKQPQHKDLFSAVRSAVDPNTHEFDSEKAFGGEKKITLDDPPTSLQIAHCLYLATLENEPFGQRFKRGIPEKLKARGEDDLPKSYYSLTEIAIRLSELMRGQVIQGGANRQAVYDDVIEDLLKGAKGPLKVIKSLHPLLEKMEGKSFETLHVDTKKNPHHRRSEKSRALRSLATAGILAASAIATPVGIHHHQKAKQQEAAEQAVRQYINNELRNVNYGLDMSLRLTVNAEKINQLAGLMHRELELRYSIPLGKQLELNLGPLFQQFLMEDTSRLQRVCENNRRFALAVDLFMHKNRILLESNGVQLGRPYASLQPYLGIIADAADKEIPSLTVDLDWHECTDPRMCAREQREKPKSLGTFMSHDYAFQRYELYIVEENGKQILLAREDVDPEILDRFKLKPDRIANTEKAKKAARELIKDLKTFEITDLMDLENDFWNYTEKSSINYVPEGIEDATPSYSFQKKRTYADPFDAFRFEIIEDSYHDPVTNAYKKCIKARIPGVDTRFTMQRTREAAFHFDQAIHDKLYNSNKGSY